MRPVLVARSRATAPAALGQEAIEMSVGAARETIPQIEVVVRLPAKVGVNPAQG